MFLFSYSTRILVLRLQEEFLFFQKFIGQLFGSDEIIDTFIRNFLEQLDLIYLDFNYTHVNN